MSNSYQDIQRFATFFKALGDPSRLTIFLRLASCCTPEMKCEAGAGWKACVGELGNNLGIVPSTVSHHIKILNQAGLIKMERHGKYISCWADRETLKTLQEFMAHPPGINNFSS